MVVVAVLLLVIGVAVYLNQAQKAGKTHFVGHYINPGKVRAHLPQS